MKLAKPARFVKNLAVVGGPPRRRCFISAPTKKDAVDGGKTWSSLLLGVKVEFSVSRETSGSRIPDICAGQTWGISPYPLAPSAFHFGPCVMSVSEPMAPFIDLAASR